MIVSNTEFGKCAYGHEMILKQYNTKMWGNTYTLYCDRCGIFRDHYKKGLVALKEEWDNSIAMRRKRSTT